MSGEKPLKPMPRLRTDEEAERFVAEADLTEYDLSGFKPMRFELRRKDRTVSLRLPVRAAGGGRAGGGPEGIPYQRLMRHAIEQATHRTTKPDQPGS